MNLIKWFGMLAVMLALTGFVMAESNDSDSNNLSTTQSQALNVRYDHLQCKVDFTSKQIDILAKYVPTVNQSANKQELLADMTELKVFVTKINKTGFDNYVTETLRPDLNNATRDLNAAKKNFKQYNLSNESKIAMIAELKSAKETYSECASDKELKMSEIMEKHMEKWNNQLEKIVEKMNKKNITTTNMTEILNEITERNAKLQELIDQGNITAMREFMKAYHDSQFHYAARFEIARLNGYKEKLKPLADRYNMSNSIRNINEKIGKAEKYAKEGYTDNDSEHQKMWSDIMGAGKDIRDAAKSINDERFKERQGKMDEKQQQMQNKQEGRINRSNNSGRGN